MLRRVLQGAGGGGGCTNFMHSLRRMTMAIRPSHPGNGGSEHIGFSPTRQALGAGGGGKGGQGYGVTK